MRVLVTGANGLIGSRLCHQLVRDQHVALGLSRGPRRTEGAWNYETCELASREAVKDAFDRFRPEVVIHCASATDVEQCESDREAAFAGNVLAAAHVAGEARQVGAHLIHVSTDYVFAGGAGPYDEEALPDAKSIYGITKRMGEDAARSLSDRWAIVRTSVVYGWPPARRPNFGSWLWSSLERGERVRLFADQIVSPSLALHVAAMLLELAARRLTGIWNLCGAEPVDRVTFGRRFCEVFGFDPGLIVPVQLADAGLQATRPLRGGLRADKALAQLQTQPLTIAESLRRFREERRSFS
jgi:dTDP-4-dehydrorhamnose reductase